MTNPALSQKIFTKMADTTESGMTMEGTINKSLILVSLTIISAILTWKYIIEYNLFLYLIPILILGLIISFVIIFFKKTAPYLAWLYAIIEGIGLGVISLLFEMQYEGIVIQTVLLTFTIIMIMLILYKHGVIKATRGFRTGVMAATGAIAVVYIISLVGNLSGLYSLSYIHESGPIGIAVSVIAVSVAAMNLILDFDNIEIGAKVHAPKYMEWYASFGLLITLVWLYLEVLELLAKSRKK